MSNIPLEKENRKLVWHDEFDGEKIDKRKWSNERLMDNSATVYDNSEKHMRIEDGMLHLQVHRSGDTYSLPEAVTTKYTMLFRYGYVEMRARIPYSIGAWPSFWLKSDTPYLKKEEGRNNYFVETDIFEVFSSKCTAVSNLHKWGRIDGKPVHEMYWQEGKQVEKSYTFKNFENLNNEFHIYGLLWDEHSIKFSVDGEWYFEAAIDENSSWKSESYPDVKGFHDPQYLILNNEIFTESRCTWMPEGTSLTKDSKMPIDYYVDYIRLYQKGENEKLYQGAELAEAYDTAKEK